MTASRKSPDRKVESGAPLLIACAPNGAFKTRSDHAALPLTAAELAATAAAAHTAGARMLHLHVRDAKGAHTLDAAAYESAIAAVRAEAGGGLFIQITSEAAGVYDAAAQRRALYAAGDSPHRADGVSLALRELIREDADRAPAAALFRHLAAREILPQYILFSAADIAGYADLLARGVIPAGGHSVLLVAGRDGMRNPKPAAVRGMVAALRAAAPPVQWMLCAFGDHEFACLREAAKLGGHVRVGFENCLVLRDRRPARDNRELIAQFARFGNPGARPPADARQAWEILGAA